MRPSVLAIAAAVLAIERVAYALVWRRPDAFARLCHRVAQRDPVDVLAAMFVVFKVLQVSVFAAWQVAHGGGFGRASDSVVVLVIGVALIAAGQLLNLAVFARLGRTGVFYGNRLGHHVPWCLGFPFSVVRHPQYVGTVLSIWGLFIAMRWPAPDWAALPLLQTVYYLLGARAEQSSLEEMGATDLGVITADLAPPARVAGRPASPRLP